MTASRLFSSTDRVKLAALALALTALAGCGSSGSDAATPVDESVTTQVEGEEAAPTTAAEVVEDTSDVGAVDDCDYDTFEYTPFTEIPDTWPSTFPKPEGLEEISGDVGMGCDRVTVDMRSRYYGASRDWVAAYGEQLSAAGFTLDNEYDELGQLTLTYRSGNDVISYGGPIEREGGDGEYIAVGVVMTDFPD